MIDIYALENDFLIESYQNKDMEQFLNIASQSIFLIPVKNKSSIEKISVEAMMDSEKDFYLPLFINMNDLKKCKMIRGKNILVAHIGMVEEILKKTTKIKGITINPRTLDCKLLGEDVTTLFQNYHKNEDKLTFDPEFYENDIMKMSDLTRTKKLIPRSEVLVTVSNYLNKTTIKKAYVLLKEVGGKLHYNFIIDYSRKEQSFIDELQFILDKTMEDTEEYEINTTKKGIFSKAIRYASPFFERRK